MDNSWLSRRGCGIHMTIRDVDCENFDAEAMAKSFHEMGVSFFSFFAGGYITTYPSKLQDSRLSPWLGTQDITGDIVSAAHKYGIKAIAMADLSILPPEVRERHPEWAMVNKDGEPYLSVSGMYTACVMGGYAEEYGRAMVAELLGKYDVDAMKFGGGSYGFNANICHCKRCCESFKEASGLDIPLKADWGDPQWKAYYKWRTVQTSRRVHFLHDMVTAVKLDMPVMGNGVCFSDPEWTINSALDMEGMAAYQDMIQIEAQMRVRMNADFGHTWEDPWMPNEEGVYMTNVSDKPIWIVASYFRYPWRRSAVDYAEQKIHLAQIAASGASPMVNLSGGPPKVHENMRGFRAPTEIWQFVRDHNEYFTKDRSGADVAIVYSDRSMVFFGKDNPRDNYLAAVRGYEQALREFHIPFDIISKNKLDEQSLSRYRTLILPNYACMSEEEAGALSAFVARGGNIVSTFATSLYDSDGEKRDNLLLGDLFGVRYSGTTMSSWGEKPRGKQNYLRMDEQNPINAQALSAGLIPVTGDFCKVQITDGEAASVLGCPFTSGPEGMSYPKGDAMGDPGAVTKVHQSGGKTVYFPVQMDRLYHIVSFGEVGELLASAVLWTLDGKLRATCNAPDSVLLTLRLQDNRTNVHLVNRTGGRRMLRNIVPVHNITVYISEELGSPKRAYLLSTGEELALRSVEGGYEATVPVLSDYDVLVFE